MAVQIVADGTGHTEHTFAVDDEAEVAKAMARFHELVKNQKMTAYDAGKQGQGARLLREFDATVEKTIFMPQRQGG